MAFEEVQELLEDLLILAYALVLYYYHILVTIILSQTGESQLKESISGLGRGDTPYFVASSATIDHRALTTTASEMLIPSHLCLLHHPANACSRSRTEIVPIKSNADEFVNRKIYSSVMSWRDNVKPELIACQ